MLSYPGNGANCNKFVPDYRYHYLRQTIVGVVTNSKCDDIIGTAPNVVLCLSRYFIMALSLCLPHAIQGSLFFNPLSSHVVFERSTDAVWHYLSGTSDGWVDSLDQVT